MWIPLPFMQTLLEVKKESTRAGTSLCQLLLD